MTFLISSKLLPSAPYRSTPVCKEGRPPCRGLEVIPCGLRYSEVGVTAGLQARIFTRCAPTSIRRSPSGLCSPKGGLEAGEGGWPRLGDGNPHRHPSLHVPSSTPGAPLPPPPPPAHPARRPYPARGRRGCRTARAPAARGPRSCAPPCRSCWPRRTAATRTPTPRAARGSGGTRRGCRPPEAAGAASRPQGALRAPGPRRPAATHRPPAPRTAPAARGPLARPSRHASPARPPVCPAPRGAQPAGPLALPPGGLEQAAEGRPEQRARSLSGAQDAPPPSAGRRGGGAEPGGARGRAGGAGRGGAAGRICG